MKIFFASTFWLAMRYNPRYIQFIDALYFAISITIAFLLAGIIYAIFHLPQVVWLLFTAPLFILFAVGPNLTKQCLSIVQGFLVVASLSFITALLGNNIITLWLILIAASFIAYYYFPLNPKFAAFGVVATIYLVMGLASPSHFSIAIERVVAITVGTLCTLLSYSMFSLLRSYLSTGSIIKDWLQLLKTAVDDLIAHPAPATDFNELVKQQILCANFTRDKNISSAILLERITSNLMVYCDRISHTNGQVINQIFRRQLQRYFICMKHNLVNTHKMCLTEAYQQLEAEVGCGIKDGLFEQWSLPVRVSFTDAIFALQMVAIDLDKLLKHTYHEHATA